MNKEEKNTSEKKSVGVVFRKIFGGAFFTNQFLTDKIKFIAFIVVLLMITMYNKYLTENTISNIYKIKKEVIKLKATSSQTAELMYLSKESAVLEMLEKKNIEIKPLKEQPIKIEIKKIDK